MNYPKGEDKCDVLDEMDDLCQQLERITRRIRVLQLQQKAEELQECEKRILRKKGISVGDSVVITNKYQGLQGTIGDVVRINNSFVTVETADGRRIVRGHQNVAKL